tara:strand:+ start:20650 stop:23871 length:3222 start_codon:yes stop_codon:yes gene_type:complete
MLDNTNNSFTLKKISPILYHTHINTLNNILNHIVTTSKSITETIVKKHILLTKYEQMIDDALSKICCLDISILFGWITGDKWNKSNTSGILSTESILSEKIDFIQKNFIAKKFIKSVSDNTVESPEDHIKIVAGVKETKIIFDSIIDDEQYILYGTFKKDPIQFNKIYKFYLNRYDEIINKMSQKHMPRDFKFRYIEQLSPDELLGKPIDDIISSVNLAYNNAKEYKNMPLNVLISHFMGGSINQKTYILTLLLLYDSNTKYIGTILFDFILNDDSSAALSHELYCNMHWSIQKEFEYTYRNVSKKIKNLTTEKVSYEKRVLASSASQESKERAFEKIKSANSPEGGSKSQQWLDGFLKIPFGKYKTHPVIDNLEEVTHKLKLLLEQIKVEKHIFKSLIDSDISTSHKIASFIQKVKDILNKHNVNNLSTELLDISDSSIDNIQDTDIDIDIDDDDVNNKDILSSNNKITTFALKDSVTKESFLDNLTLNAKKDIDSTSSSYEEKLSIVNGSIQRTRQHRPVPLSALKYDKSFVYKQNIFFSQKSIYAELDKIVQEWDQYEIDKREYINNIKETLDSVCYGHSEGKQAIQRLVGQWINGSTEGTIIGIEGPPGNGKTTLAKHGISKCLQDSNGETRPFGMIALGGSANGSTIVGHNFTYVGSTWGRIMDILIRSKCLNPIIYIDEVDKISKTEHGKEISGILTHMTDSTQNDSFEDKYFSGIPIDLSKAIIIMSFNDRYLIDPILRDRMHIIQTYPLTTPDKLVISKDYLLPTIYDNIGFGPNDIILKDPICKYIIDTYTHEAGVRKLKELLYELIREFNLKLITKKTKNHFPYDIKKAYIEDIFQKKYKAKVKQTHTSPKIGLINGLYATTCGIGGLTTIEIAKTHSNTFMDLTLTGSQGDVMKESIKCAKTIAWNLLPNSIKDSITPKSTGKNKPQNFGLHIHTPECATKKDGPSAGAAITLGILSVLSNTTINPNVAMTGEIDLNGNVTKIGGLQSKLLGALKSGINKVLIPFDNKEDLDIIILEKKITEINDKRVNFTVIPIHTISEMIPHVFSENNIEFNFTNFNKND